MSEPGGIESPPDPADVQAKPVGPPILKHFEYGHLDADLALISAKFHALAHELADRLPSSAELSAGLRKLLEAKDCAVRAVLETRHHHPKPAPIVPGENGVPGGF